MAQDASPHRSESPKRRVDICSLLEDFENIQVTVLKGYIQTHWGRTHSHIYIYIVPIIVPLILRFFVQMQSLNGSFMALNPTFLRNEQQQLSAQASFCDDDSGPEQEADDQMGLTINKGCHGDDRKVIESDVGDDVLLCFTHSFQVRLVYL